MTAPALAPLFRRAAEVIETNGHYKGFFYDPIALTPVDRWATCAAGALCVAIGCSTSDFYPAPGEESFALDAARFLSSRICSLVVDEDPIERIADWNDAPERTADDVVQALREAADAAEQAAA